MKCSRGKGKGGFDARQSGMITPLSPAGISRPQYTEDERRNQIMGSVVLRVVSSRTGDVTNSDPRR